jgi:hypothetical protein
MTGRYQTAAQLAQTIGGIKMCTIRSLRLQGMPAVKLGRSYLFDPEKCLAWIAEREEAACRAPIPAHGSSGSTGGPTFISCGSKGGASGVAALARQTAERLKHISPHSSANGNCHSAQLVPLTRRATQ